MSYQIMTRAPLARCSSFPLPCYANALHDAPGWENFDVNSVPHYISQAMPRIYAHLKQLEDVSEPYLPSQATELQFMIEAVIEARSLIE